MSCRFLKWSSGAPIWIPEETIEMARGVHPPLRIRDVEERAGISPATVSRLLTGTATVTEANREEILAVIDELGYRPNRVARNLRRAQVQMIGVVISDIQNPPLRPDGACRRRCRSICGLPRAAVQRRQLQIWSTVVSVESRLFPKK
jgi:hypothetical protein